MNREFEKKILFVKFLQILKKFDIAMIGILIDKNLEVGDRKDVCNVVYAENAMILLR
jgi:hypothetical protein